MWMSCRKPRRRPAGRAAPATIRAPGEHRQRAHRRSRGAGRRHHGGDLGLVDRAPAGRLPTWTTSRVTADGRVCRLSYIGPPAADGVSQVNAMLPEGLRTGLVPVEVVQGEPLCAARLGAHHAARPPVPRVTGITDGVNLLFGNRIVSGT